MLCHEKRYSAGNIVSGRSGVVFSLIGLALIRSARVSRCCACALRSRSCWCLRFRWCLRWLFTGIEKPSTCTIANHNDNNKSPCRLTILDTQKVSIECQSSFLGLWNSAYWNQESGFPFLALPGSRQIHQESNSKTAYLVLFGRAVLTNRDTE